MQIEKVEESLEFVTNMGEMTLYKVLENNQNDLLENSDNTQG